MSDPYEQLFEHYVDDLRLARVDAQAWWDSMVASERAASRGRYETARVIHTRWPCGPASHPRVIAVFRKYFLMCEEINADIRKSWRERENESEICNDDEWGAESPSDELERIEEPRFILFDRLRTYDEELGKFAINLVFIPIGMNAAAKIV